MKPDFLIAKYKSWKDLNNQLETLTKSKRSKEAGDIFEHLVKLYLQTAPQYQSKLKKVYLLNEVPESLKRKLRLPSTDEGIDLIVETYDKTYWSIQAKYRSDSKQTLTRGDLSTFSDLSFNYCNNIEHGLVCTTVDKPPRKVKLMDNIGFDTIECFYRLDDNNGEEWKAIVAKCKGKVIKPKSFKPRPHQKKALKETTSFLKNNDRGKILMPCGTGKSITAFWIAQNLKAKSILVAVPSLALLQQTLRVWTREYLIHGIRPEWLCVCSDDTVKEDQDDYVTNSSDIGVKVTTDQTEIKSFLKKRSQNIKVVFTTYQSGQVTAKGSKGFTFDLGIMDEAHKTVGHRNKPMAHLIHNKNIKVKKRVFMTATERLFRGDKDEYVSMDDSRDYGNTIYQLSFKEAIDMNPPIISDYKVITFNVNEPDIEALYQDNKFIQVQKKINNITAREFAVAIALRKAIKKLKIKNAVSFHSSIKRADNFSHQQDLITEIYKVYGKLKTFHVSGAMPTNERSSQMREFAEGRGLMTNARCLTEGVDLPAIDCVVFTDPKRSRVDIVQAAGRALRLSKGKKFGYILLPLIVPKNENASNAAEDSAFEEIVETLKALASQDTRIVDYLRAVSSGPKPKGGSPIDGLIKINKLSNINTKEFEEAITLKIWDRIAFGNWRSFEDAKNFVATLNLDNVKQWSKYCLSDLRQADIPSNPQYIYSEWRSWGDWLGTDNVATKFYKFPDFDKAIKHVHSLNLKNMAEYKKRIKKDKIHLPFNPHTTYQDNWISSGHWLGTNFIATSKRKYRSFQDAKKFAQNICLNNQAEWFDYAKSSEKPDDIPYSPYTVYKDKGWISWADWLGSNNEVISYWDFQTAKTYVQKLSLKTQTEWLLFCESGKKPKQIPSYPNQVYKNQGWISFPDFFRGELSPRQKHLFLNYDEAKKIIVRLNIKSETEWRKYKSKNSLPDRIPKTPENFYIDEWKGWGDFLGTQNVSMIVKSASFRTFENARSYARSLGLQSQKEWRSFIKTADKPKDIPSNPESAYAGKGWAGIADWLDVLPKGQGATFASFEEAKEFAKGLNINSWSEWRKWVKSGKRPSHIPSKPDKTYKDKGWISWNYFLGKK